MAELLRQHYCRHLRTSLIAAVAFLIFTSATAFGATPTQQYLGGRRCSAAVAAIRTEEMEEVGGVKLWGRIGRRLMGGPGSSPPTCRFKCSRCSPCKPVHVAIQPGFSLPLEYYPEAWRCKCGNKLFMP